MRYTVLTEPDIQRANSLIMEAAQALQANNFIVASKLLMLSPRWREQMMAEDDPLEIILQLDTHNLKVRGRNVEEALFVFRHPVDKETISTLHKKLMEQSEQADPELLKKRNEAINAALTAANERAAAVEELENLLEKKKQELKESIRQAETDSLTGLYNRGAYDIRLSEAVTRSQRQCEPLSLILLDLDYFKQINDNHGHQYGDEYLKKMADIMKHACREGVDYPCRIGGDEFAIITFADLVICKRIGNKILEQMDKRVSIGCAQLLHEETPETLIARSDEALYEAKRQGRGRLITASLQQKSLQSG